MPKKDKLATLFLILGLHRLRPKQLSMLSSQISSSYLNEDRPMTERVSAVNRWTLLPSVSYSDIVNFIVQGDVGIIPYRKNGFMELLLPTKAYEFAWMQRPMIASDTRAIRSMFRSESIVLCDHSKPESFADAIIDLY